MIGNTREDVWVGKDKSKQCRGKRVNLEMRMKLDQMVYISPLINK